MGLVTGAANFVEFEVMGDCPNLDFIQDKVRAFAFKSIDDTYDEYSVGWVSVLDPLDSEFPFNSDMSGNYVTIALRVDERKVPGATLNRLCAMEDKHIRAEKELPKLSRGMKIDIKERIRTELMRKAIPTTTTTELVWDVGNGKVLFFSTNKLSQAVFEDWFKESFGITVRQRVPFTLAETMLVAAGVLKLNNISPCLFAA